jgi:biopolymer transport protein TolQ
MGFEIFIDTLFDSGLVAATVIVLLLLLSVISWALILATGIMFRRLSIEDKRFLQSYETATAPTSISAVEISPDLDSIPLVGMRAIYQELSAEATRIEPYLKGLDLEDSRLQLIKTNFNELSQRTLERAKRREVSRRERYFAFFATISNTAPFIGLFGTVIGIIDAFNEISKVGSADLGFVAPGISQALVATALGLFVAIPASVAYNYFKSRSLSIRNEEDQFSLSLLNGLQRRYFFHDLADQPIERSDTH